MGLQDLSIGKVLFTFLGLIITAWYLRIYFSRRRLYKLAKQFEGPIPLPLIGNAIKCILPLSKIPEVTLSALKFYNSPTRFWIGPYLVICIWTPNDAKTILNNPHALNRPFELYKMVESLIGKGLITLPVDIWKLHRKLINPIFSPKNLESNYDIFCNHSEELVRKLRNKVGKGVFDVEDDITKCSFNTVLDSLLGGKSIGSVDDITYLRKNVKIVLEAMAVRTSNVLYISDFVFNMTTAGKKFAVAAKNYNNRISTIIKNWQRKALESNGNHSSIITGETESTKPKNFIEHLVLASNEVGKLTLKELQDEVSTMIIAALETTQSSMAMLLVVLGIHPDVQETLYQEIQRFGSKNKLEYKNLNNYVYLERVIKETLRLFPVTLSAIRYTDHEIELENQTIPANTYIALCLLNLHRNPEIWPDPNKFDPDRFLPEQEAKRHPYSWLPFAGGPRNCIGFRYALMALKIMTIYVTSNYVITTPYKSIEDVHLTHMMVLRPTKGYNIALNAR